MKGINKVNIDGKEVELRFTLGVLEDYQDYCEENDLDADESLQKMKHFRVFLSLMSEYAGNKVDSEKFKYMDFEEMQSALSLVEQSTSDIKGGKKK